MSSHTRSPPPFHRWLCPTFDPYVETPPPTLNRLSTCLSAIYSFKHLTNLSLQDNGITEIGPELLSLPQLKELRLDNNTLTSLKNIPKSLEYLNISCNRLTELSVC